VTIQIGAPTNSCYPVTAIGSSGSTVGGGAMTRTIFAEICSGTTFTINQAGAFNGPLAMSSLETFTSTDSATPAIVTSSSVSGSGSVNGNIEATSVSGVTQTNGTVSGAPLVAPAPNSGTVTDYSQPYVYQGVEYYPTSISAPLSSSYGPTPSNPLGIYCYGSGTQTLNVTKALAINGTLMIKGSLNTTYPITITPVATTLTTNYPALVVTSKLTLTGHTAALNATGLVYLGLGMVGSGTNSSTNVTVNGALLVTSGAITGYSGTMSVTYNPSYTNIPNFASSNTTPCVKIISWSE
jgi:hypothetical protein